MPAPKDIALAPDVVYERYPGAASTALAVALAPTYRPRWPGTQPVQSTAGDAASYAGEQVLTSLDSQAVVGGVAESLLAMGNLDGMKCEATALLQRVNAALAHHAGEQPPT